MARTTKEELLVRSLIDKIGPIDLEAVISQDTLPNGKHMIKLNGRRASDNEVLNLKKEAEMFEQTSLYKMLTETLRYQAHFRMFRDFKRPNGDSITNEEVYEAGKYLLHAISTLEHIIWAAKNPQLLEEEKVIHKPGNRLVDKRREAINNNN